MQVVTGRAGYRRLRPEEILDGLPHYLAADVGDGFGQGQFFGADLDAVLRVTAFLLLCGLLLFLPGFFNIPPIDRDEARFAQATKQMVETGDFIDIRFQDDVRYKKPVGVYWLQAAAVETASNPI